MALNGVAIEPSQNYSNSVIDVIGNEIYILTSADAPRNRIVKARFRTRPVPTG